MTTFIFDTPNGVIREKPSMHEPHPMYENMVISYKKHIASLRSYPYDPSLLERFGKNKELIKGVDFRLYRQCTEHSSFCCLPGSCVFCETIAMLIDEDTLTAEIVNKTIILKQEKGQPPMFTLQDMMDAYEAGIGDVNGTEKAAYFKSKHNIDI